MSRRPGTRQRNLGSRALAGQWGWPASWCSLRGDWGPAPNLRLPVNSRHDVIGDANAARQRTVFDVGGLTEDLGGVAVERGGVLVYPLKGGDPVRGRPDCRRRPASPGNIDSEAVVEADRHDAVSGKRRAVEPRARAGTGEEATPVDPHEHGHLAAPGEGVKTLRLRSSLPGMQRCGMTVRLLGLAPTVRSREPGARRPAIGLAGLRACGSPLKPSTRRSCSIEAGAGGCAPGAMPASRASRARSATATGESLTSRLR
jgi:hypothetical protein